MGGAGPGGLALRPQRDPSGPHPPVGGLLADPVALADLRGTQPLDLVQPAKLLAGRRMAASTGRPSWNAGVFQPSGDRRCAHPIPRGELRGRQAIRNVAAAKLHWVGGPMASAALGLGARRDAKLPQPAADRAAADPEPLADLDRAQPLLLVEPAQLLRRDASAHSHGSPPKAPRWTADSGWFHRGRKSRRFVLTRDGRAPAILDCVLARFQAAGCAGPTPAAVALAAGGPLREPQRKGAMG